MSTELELQQKYQKILNTCKKDLYNMYKINWNDKDSIKYTYGEGSFTVNSIAKIANPSDNIVFVLFEEKECEYTGEVSYTIHMLELYNSEKDKLKFTDCELLSWNRYVKSLCTQQDINSARKAATSYCIIQVPKSSIIKIEKEKTIQDFINSGKLFDNRIKVIKREGHMDVLKINGRQYELNSYRYGNVYACECFCEKLDKSGYYTEVFKLRRLSKLTKIHYDQVKEYLKSADYQNKMKELKELLKQVKEVYISKLQKAETCEQIYSIREHFTLEHFYSSVEDIQDFVENTLNPNYDSHWRIFNNIQEFENNYNEAYNEINTCIKSESIV